MDVLNYIIGKAECGKPACMRFYGPVDRWSCQDFVNALDWVAGSVKPSEIIVFVNSEGGSVISGMSVFSALNSCGVKTKCVVDGIAASMGSVIWSAGQELYMRDYSLLMIHNPFVGKCDPDDKDTCAAVDAFKKQLKTVYMKRFGLDEETVGKIMDGAEGCDGTYLTAREAVDMGLIPAAHVIATCEQTRASMAERVAGVDDSRRKAELMAGVDLSRVVAQMSPALTAVEGRVHDGDTELVAKPNPENTVINNNKKMNDKEKAFEFVCATLDLAQDSTQASVTAKVKELMAAAKELEGAKAELAAARKAEADLKIQLEGKAAELTNLSAQLAEASAELKKYKDAEAAAKEAEIAAVIDQAVKDGKIKEDAKEQWTAMAKGNFDLVKATLASIAGRQDIVAEIANDPANQKDTVEATVGEVEARVKAVLGDFEFKKF